MNYKEYGKGNAETVILLHGGGLSWWNYREAARFLEPRYHIVLPILDGHAGSDRHFTSIEDNASEIIAFIDDNLGGSAALIGGLSLGGQVLLEMLSQRGDICRCALAESAAVLPSKLTRALIGPAFDSSYALIKNRSFAKLQFGSLRMPTELFEDYYRDTCLIEKRDMIAFMKASAAYALKPAISAVSAEVHVYAGERERKVILDSAEAIRKAVLGSVKTTVLGLYHGGFSMRTPREYAEAAERMIRG